jgi:indolepyruvate ferredoxin oxidoreductase
MNHTITYILLDNDNTAMTGHQVTPATGENIQGQKRPKQKMLEVVRSLGVQDCIEVQPSDRYFYKNVLWELMEKPGTKVVVSTKECALTFQSRLKKEERLQFQKNHVIPSKTFYQINTDACEDCRECVEMTGCPGLTQTFDAYGTKVSIDPFICVSDSYCTTMKACPSFEKIDVFDYHPTLHLQQSSQEQSIPIQLPQPTIKHSFHDIAAGKAWRVVVTGVGGSGITTISRLLAEAAKDMEQREDVSFQFFDQKGLAQRNGSVIGFLSFFKKDQAHCLMLPYHSAHLILSTDHYEGLRSLNYLSEEGTAIIDEQAQSPLSILLDKAEDQDPWREEEFIKWFHEQASIGMKQVQIHPMKDKAAKLFGKTVYASTFCLGVAFQQGLLPFSESSLLQAIKQTIPKSEQKNNEEAFYQGRLYALSFLEKKNHFDEHLQKKQNRSLVEDDQQKWMVSLKASFHKGHDFFFPKKEKKIMEAYREDCQMMGRLFPHVNINSLYQYVHDFYLYGHGDQQKKWRLDLQQLAISYPEENVQTLALRLFVKTYFIKDEVFVAHLLSSPHKEKKDRDMYQHLGSTFQVAHINRPRFDFGWFSWEFDWESRPWMLKIMKHQRWLRRILPHWHKREKHLALWIRHQLLKEIPILSLEEKNKALRKIEQIKGYREKRWALWNEYFPKTELKFVNQNEKVL